MRKSKIMEKRPQYVVAITVVILMNNFFIQEYRDTPLQEQYQKGKQVQNIGKAIFLEGKECKAISKLLNSKKAREVW